MKNSNVGGGARSRNVKQVGMNFGKPAMKYNPKGVSQIGSSIGDHATEHGRMLRGGVEKVRAGAYPAGTVGSVPLGNQLAKNVGAGGPGTGREVFRCGTQGPCGPTRSPNATGRDTLAEYGPESAQVRNRK
jgi:hypothetical protein